MGLLSQILAVFTTRTMLKNLLHTRKLPHGGFFSIDGKWKMNWNGYPLEVMGTVDADCHFNAGGYALVSQEDEGTFRTIILTLFTAAHLEFPQFDMRMAYGESDNSDAIGNAAESLCPDMGWEWLNCYMHLTVCNISKNGTTLNKALTSTEQGELVSSIIQQLSNIPWILPFDACMRIFIDALLHEDDLDSELGNRAFAAALIKEYYPHGAGQFLDYCEENELPSTSPQCFMLLSYTVL